MKKIAVIGGGASGLYIANLIGEHFAQSSDRPQITIYEKNNKIAKKLSATGNGRCNLSNINIDVNMYSSIAKSDNFLSSIITNSNYEKTMDFFKRHGLLCFNDNEGRVYPYAESTASVINILTENLNQYNINVLTEMLIDDIRQKDNGYLVYCNNESYFYDIVIVCTGGKASPKFGTDGNFFNVLSNLGIIITPLYPLLNGLSVGNKYKSISGVRLNGLVTLYANDGKEKNNKNTMNVKPVYKEKGQIQFTEKGISGIVVMNISSKIVEYLNCNPTLSIDFFYAYSKEELVALLHKRSNTIKDTNIERLLQGIINVKVAKYIAENAKVSSLHSLNDQIDSAVNILKSFKVDYTSLLGFDTAQITGGGVDLTEIDSNTLQLKKLDNLYVIGEAADVHGMCGGYNLQWCWSSANNAAKDIINKLELCK